MHKLLNIFSKNTILCPFTLLDTPKKSSSMFQSGLKFQQPHKAQLLLMWFSLEILGLLNGVCSLLNQYYLVLKGLAVLKFSVSSVQIWRESSDWPSQCTEVPAEWFICNCGSLGPWGDKGGEEQRSLSQRNLNFVLFESFEPLKPGVYSVYKSSAGARQFAVSCISLHLSHTVLETVI